MMSELTRLLDESTRLLTTYAEHRECDDPALRRKVHIDMDRFLMEHRATAMALMIQGLDAEIEAKITGLSTDNQPAPNVAWYKWLFQSKAQRRGNTKNLVGNTDCTINLGQTNWPEKESE